MAQIDSFPIDLHWGKSIRSEYRGHLTAKVKIETTNKTLLDKGMQIVLNKSVFSNLKLTFVIHFSNLHIVKSVDWRVFYFIL